MREKSILTKDLTPIQPQPLRYSDFVKWRETGIGGRGEEA
jgi:hypothetical protein